jgi:hypothetical protein
MTPIFYNTFKRSCTNWKTFAKSRKITVGTHLSFDDAWQQCKEFNTHRNARQIRNGTMMEFTSI